jgi:hypothetical protein
MAMKVGLSILLAGMMSSVAHGAEIIDLQRPNPVEHADHYDLSKETYWPGTPRSFYEVGIETTAGLFGKAEEYVIILQNQGSVFYHGIANTRKGYFVGEDANNVGLISELLDTMDLRSYADRYTVDLTHQYTTFLYIKDSTGTKVIEASSPLMPFKLRLLEALILSSIDGVKLKRHNWAKEER